MPLCNPAAEVPPLRAVRLVRPVRRLPLVVDHDRPRDDPVAFEMAEEAVVALLSREVARACVVCARQMTLGTPAAEDRRAPPGRRLSRHDPRRGAAGGEVVAVPAEPDIRVVRTGRDRHERRVELAVDARVAVVLEAEAESAIRRHVYELYETELLDGCGERDPDPPAGDASRLVDVRRRQPQGQRRRREAPVSPAGVAFPGDADDRAFA